MGYYSDHSAGGGGGVRGGSQYPTLDQRQYYDDSTGGRGYPAGGGVGGNGQAYYDQQPMGGVGRPPTSTNTGYGMASSDADFAKMRQMYDEEY